MESSNDGCLDERNLRYPTCRSPAQAQLTAVRPEVRNKDLIDEG